MGRRIGLLIGIASILLTLVATGGVVAAQPNPLEGRKFDGRNVALYANSRQSALLQRANFTHSASVLGGTPTADIQVTYTGFTANAQAAFEAAVEVWEHVLVSDQPIHVDAKWKALGSGILGSAGPESFWLGDDDHVYPAALMEAICSCDEEPGFEISANFNKNFSSWYLGTDGNTPSDKWDFFTVVLHELGHGLGFMSSFEVFSGKGYWGFTNNGIDIYPLKYDSYEVTASTAGNSLISDYGNGTAALKDELVDGSVFFDGPNTVAAAGGRVRLYAPSPWQQGSSNSHVNEATYSGTEEGLMTPSLANGEVLHVPGPVTIAMFQDIGWEVATPGGGGPPENDNFMDASAIGLNSTSTATTTDATLETDEPQPACATAVDKTVWYTFTPGITRTVVAKTVGSDFDTVLAIYTATEPVGLTTLVPVACNDNRAVDSLSKLKLSLTGGTTYYFQVGGANGESGSLTVRLKKP